MMMIDDIFVLEPSKLSMKLPSLVKAKRAFGFMRTLNKAYIEALYMNLNDITQEDKVLSAMQKYAKIIMQQLDIRVQVHGQLPSKSVALQVSNHVSWLDPVIYATFKPALFVAKAETVNWFVLGTLIKAAGTVFIKRGSGDALYIAKQIAKALNKGASVMFFPEATTSAGYSVQKIHGKLLNAALLANTPIQPMLVLYQDANGVISKTIPFCGEQTFIDNLSAVLGHGGVTAHVLVLEPIAVVGHTEHTITTLLKQKMDDGFKQLKETVLFH